MSSTTSPRSAQRILAENAILKEQHVVHLKQIQELASNFGGMLIAAKSVTESWAELRATRAVRFLLPKIFRERLNFLERLTDAMFPQAARDAITELIALKESEKKPEEQNG